MSKQSDYQMYRVYDSKNNYAQSYTSELSEGFTWAKSCAKRMNGRVDEVLFMDGEETSKTVFESK